MQNSRQMANMAKTFGVSQAREVLSQLIRFFTWPIIVRGLGTEMYGAWVLVGQSTQFAGVADLKLGSVLVLLLSHEQHNPDDSVKRRIVGAHLRICALMMLLFTAVGLIASAVSVRFFSVGADIRTTFMIAVFLGVLQMGIRPFVGTSGAALRAANLGYLGGPAMLLLDILVPVGSAVVVVYGGQLAGLASLPFIGSLAAGVVMLAITRRTLRWFGSERPNRSEWSLLLKTGFSVQLDGVASAFMVASVGIWLGRLKGMEAVAIYAITARIVEIARSALGNVAAAVAPVFGAMLGKGERESAIHLYQRLTSLSTFVSCVVFASVCPVNRTILTLLTGKGTVASFSGNILITAAVLVLSLSTAPSFLIPQTLRIRGKNLWSIIYCVVVSVAAFFLVPKYGIEGMAVATLVSGLAIYLGYSSVLCRILRVRSLAMLAGPLWAIGCSLVLAVSGGWLQEKAAGRGLWLVAALAVVQVAVTFVVIGLILYNKNERRDYIRRALSILRRFISRKAADSAEMGV